MGETIEKTGMGKAARIACALLLLVCSLFLLSGCRFSDSLAELVVDPVNGEYEPELDPEYQDVDDAEEDSTRASTHESESDNEADEAAVLPTYDPDASENGEAKNRPQEEDSDEDEEASEGEDPSDDADASTASGQEGEGGEASGADDSDEDEEEAGAGEGAAESEELSGEEGDEASAESTAGRGGSGQTYGADGTYEELPEARAIAATGQYALITQMLAGAGGLAAADEDWLEEIQATGAFSGEGLEDVVVAWSGDGTAEGSLDVDAVIASDADVVLTDGVTVVLTDEETEELHDAGIDTVSVPVLGLSDTSDDDVVTAVQVVGQLLSSYKSEASLDTAQMVESYLEFHDEAIEACKDSNGGYSYKMVVGKSYQGIYQGSGETGTSTSELSDVRITTAFIDSLASPSAPTAIADRQFGFRSLYLDGETIDISDGVGLSATVTSGNFALLDYYLQVSGVVNNAYNTARPVSTSGDSDSTLPYPVVAGSGTGLVDVELGVREVPSALWYSMYGVELTDTWTCVGDEEFPGIIVRSQEIADAVASSANKVDGLYNVGQSYEIWVVPEGLSGSWADGNVESFLVSLWAYGVFQEGDTATCEEWTDDFYALFYRVDDATDGDLIAGWGSSETALCPTS